MKIILENETTQILYKEIEQEAEIMPLFVY